jgi:hypothetical protein
MRQRPCRVLTRSQHVLAHHKHHKHHLAYLALQLGPPKTCLKVLLSASHALHHAQGVFFMHTATSLRVGYHTSITARQHLDVEQCRQADHSSPCSCSTQRVTGQPDTLQQLRLTTHHSAHMIRVALLGRSQAVQQQAVQTQRTLAIWPTPHTALLSRIAQETGSLRSEHMQQHTLGMHRQQQATRISPVQTSWIGLHWL